MESKEKNQRPGDGRKKVTILVEESAHCTGSSSERDEDHGEASDKRERGREQARPRNFTFA
jgi:hypothetical protein